MNLKISEQLQLPPDAVTQTLIVYGMKGMGKTVFIAVLCEELAKTGHKFSYVDPIGPGYGLRYASDGRGRGIDIVVLGGRHGDIPVEPTAGAIVADFVVNEHVNTVIDISRWPDGKMWKKGEKIRFMADYCERLFERQGEKCYPMMQIIDEAGRFVPQLIPAQSLDLSRCVGAIEQLTEEGRNVGIGICLVTQRSARMNKSVSELAECMIAFRTVGPNSVQSILDWLGEHVPKARHNEILEQLRTHPKGNALVVSPGWLNFEGVVKMRMRKTFDSSVTPTADRQLVTPRTPDKKDLERYKTLMAATIEKVKADDPTLLKRQVAELKLKLAKAESRPAPTPMPLPAKIETVVEVERVNYPIITPSQDGLLSRIASICGEMKVSVENVVHQCKLNESLRTDVMRMLETAIKAVPQPSRSLKTPAIRKNETPRPAPATAQQIYTDLREDAASSNGEGTSLSRCAAAILTVLLSFPGGRTKSQAAMLSGYSVNSSTFANALTDLSKADAIVRSGDMLTAKPEAMALVPTFDPLPKGEDLRKLWANKLGSGAARSIFDYLLEKFPNYCERQEISDATGYSIRSSTFANALTELRAPDLVEENGMKLRASQTLFEQ